MSQTKSFLVNEWTCRFQSEKDACVIGVAAFFPAKVFRNWGKCILVESNLDSRYRTLR